MKRLGDEVPTHVNSLLFPVADNYAKIARLGSALQFDSADRETPTSDVFRFDGILHSCWYSIFGDEIAMGELDFLCHTPFDGLSPSPASLGGIGCRNRLPIELRIWASIKCR